MKIQLNFIKAFILSILLAFSVQSANAQSLNFNSNLVLDKVNSLLSLDFQTKARGFRSSGSRKSFGMNFGGNGSKTNNTTANKNNTTDNKAANNTATNNSAKKAGLLGFLGGLGLMGLLMGGFGLLGGGFLIYLLIAFLIPFVIAYFKNKQNNNLATSSLSSTDLFKKQDNNDLDKKF